MGGNSKITELNANISSYVTVSGSCTFDAVSLDGNARVDAITGGIYEAYYTEELVALKPAGGSFEKGAWSTGFRWNFEGLVNASGCSVVDTGKTAQVQWSKRVDTHNLVILEVVAQ